MSCRDCHKERTIVDVAADVISGNLAFAPDEVVEARIAQCRECPWRRRVLELCRKCGCLLAFKVRDAAATCPDGRWPDGVPTSDG